MALSNLRNKSFDNSNQNYQNQSPQAISRKTPKKEPHKDF